MCMENAPEGKDRSFIQNGNNHSLLSVAAKNPNPDMEKAGILIWRRQKPDRLLSSRSIMNPAIITPLEIRSKQKNGIMSGCKKQGSGFRP